MPSERFLVYFLKNILSGVYSYYSLVWPNIYSAIQEVEASVVAFFFLKFKFCRMKYFLILLEIIKPDFAVSQGISILAQGL